MLCSCYMQCNVVCHNFYSGNVTVQVPVSNTGTTRVHSGVNNHLQIDYEDIDGHSRPNRNHTRLLLPTNSRNNDYRQPPNPHDTNGYAVPFQTPTKV